MPWRAMPLAPVAIAFAAGVGLAPWARPDVAWTTWLAALASTGALLLKGRTAGATALLLVGVAAVGALHGMRGAPAARPRRPPRSAADGARGWAARRRAGLVGPRSRPSPHRGRARRRPRALGTDPGDRVRRGATARPRPADHGRAAPPPRDRLPQSWDVRLRRAPQARGHPRHGNGARRPPHAGRPPCAALARADQARVGGGDLPGVATRLRGAAGRAPAGRADRPATRARRGLPPRRRLSRPPGVRLP